MWLNYATMDCSITINDTNIAFSRQGNGSPMILLHGWGCDRSALALFERVGIENHEVFNIDLPGFGQSDEPSFAWTVEDYTSMLEQFVIAMGISSPIVLGHSFGGRIGILFASRNEVESLILVDAAGIKPRRNLKQLFNIYKFKIAKALWRLYGKEKSEMMIAEARNKRGSSDYRNASPLMKQVLVKAVNSDLKSVMPSISAPTLLIWGENDTATPMRDARKMLKLIPNSRLISFPGAGHFSFIDNPYQAAAAVRHITTSTGAPIVPEA